MNYEIVEIVDKYKKYGNFFGKVSEEDIINSENKLNMKFPEQYRDFIKNYGSGGILGINLEGVEGDLGSSVVEGTERYRRLGLDSNMVVISDSGEFVHCMDSRNINSGVYSWYRDEKVFYLRFNSFDEFLIYYIKESIDNFDEGDE